MLNLIRADVFKLRKSITMKVLLAITTLCAVAMTMMAYFISTGKLDASLTGVGFMFSDVNVISILGGLIAGMLICADFDNKTIQDSIASGNSRSTIIFSKAVVLGLALVVILLPYAVITGIALGTGSKFDMGAVAVGFLHLLTSESAKAFTTPDVLKLLAVMLTLLILYVAQLSISIPIAFLVKKPILVIVICYAFSFLTGQLLTIASNHPIVERICSFTPFGGSYVLMTLDAGAGTVVKAIVVSLIFIGVMAALSYSLFRKTEIK
ncbi:ABC transporter permease [Paenibacillus puldeungensis]|uniref:ABC transporter permease n=1 Tax=Paenibacillus puldeungensis TaxID=696536 RepID=A0ABW3RVR3_9BACL